MEPADKRDRFDSWDTLIHAALADGKVHDAFDTLIQGYQHFVVGYCVVCLGDAMQGEDVAQEVFLSAYQGLSQVQGSVLYPWIMAIARNKCWQYLRNRQRRYGLLRTRHRRVAETIHLQPPTTPEQRYLDGEAEVRDAQSIARLLRALGQLTHQDAMLLMMRYYEGLSYQDIADHTQCSEATARRAIRKVLNRLRTVVDTTSDA